MTSMNASNDRQMLITKDGNSNTDYQYHQLPGTHTPEYPGTPDMSINLQEEPTTKKKCTDLISKLCSVHVWKMVGLGQLLSLLICGTGVTSGLLQEQGVHTPTAQSFLNYVLLCLVYTVILACRRDDERPLLFLLKTYWWKYIILAIIDVEANYLVVKAYNYTTVTSVQLLDCFSIAMVMVLSFFILHVRYKPLHIVGVVFCLLGLGGLVAADVISGKNSAGTTGATNKVLGDFLVILGAALYGMSNVGEEYVVKTYARAEFLGMLGLFGSFISGLQFIILERDEVSNLDFTRYQIVLPWLGFVACQFILYSFMTVVIQYTSATSVNLSILSADFYSLLFGLFLFHYQFHVLYFLAFALIIAGIAIYSMRDTAVRGGSASMENS